MNRVARVAVLVVACTVAAGPAWSQPDRRAEAAERFDRGLKLFNDGDNAAALAEFKRANELVPNRLVLFNIGLVYAAMKRPVDATQTLDRVLADPGPLSAERLTVARATRDEQAKRVGFLELTTNVPAVVEVDGVETAKTPLQGPLPVASGTRIASVVAAGHLPVRKEVTVAGAARVPLALQLQPSDTRLAQLVIRTSLPGVDVFIDGELAGRTPLA